MHKSTNTCQILPTQMTRCAKIHAKHDQLATLTYCMYYKADYISAASQYFEVSV